MNHDASGTYLDHAATTPTRPEARQAMAEAAERLFGNPSSGHAWGRAASAALEEARGRVAAALRTEPRRVHFVRGGTESDNLAVLGRALRVRRGGGEPHVVHSAIEHRAVIEAAGAVETLGGRRTQLAVSSDGTPDWDTLTRSLDAQPSLVSVMSVNNEVGLVLPVADVVRAARARGVPVHSDAVQTVGKIGVDLSEPDAPDLLTVTGHKLGGPRGTGLLVGDRELLDPVVVGGGQERGLRAGTEDVEGAIGMAIAVELAVSEQRVEAERLRALRDRLERALTERVDGLVVHAGSGPRAPHVLNVGVPVDDASLLVAAFDVEGLGVSSGSACASGSVEPSHVLLALGHASPGRASVRYSFGWTSSDEDVDRAVEITQRVLARLGTRILEPSA